MAKLLFCNAQTVTDSFVASVQTPMPTRKRKSPQKYPSYEEGELAVVLRFLAAYLTEFQENLRIERELAKDHPTWAIFAGRVKYREHQVATVMELVKRAYWPQKHLALVPDDEIKRRIIECLQHSQTS